MPFRYPVALELKGRRCVVIGGGDLAEEKAKGLLEAEGDVELFSPAFTEGLEKLAAEGKVKLTRRQYRAGDLAGAFVAVGAGEDPEQNKQAFAEARASSVLFNAVDDVPHCDFAAPSIIRRGDFLLTISTGGKAPALAKRLRKRLSAEFGPEYEQLVDMLGDVRARALPERTVDFKTWAARWGAAVKQDLVGLIRAAKVGVAQDLVWRHVSGQLEEPDGKGHVWIVGAGPGDPGLITVRGREALDLADVVVSDRLVNPSLIEGKEAIYVGKAPGCPSKPQEEINQLLIDLASEGKHVVRLKGGDPFVFGRGSEEAEALAAAGIDFTVVSGTTSAVAALASAGIPVTDRRFSSSVVFITGHCGDNQTDWTALAKAADTIVVLMGLANFSRIADELIKGGLDPATPSAIIENGTLPSQRVITGELSALPTRASEAGVSSPAIIAIGRVVGLRDKLQSPPGA